MDVDRLIEACGDASQDAGITIRTELEPLAGPGAPVKPAVYAGGRYQRDKRWWGEGTERRVTDVIVIDNEPSQANRLEAALERLRPQLGLPEIVLDLSSVGELPPHLPRQISSFRFPHRNADAYLRDSGYDGKPFLKTPEGQAIFAATADNPAALFQWFPQALVFGFWQSHLGTKRSQAKLARAWFSEIAGVGPATTETRRRGTKGDPLNLNSDEKVSWDEERGEWSPAQGGKAKKLSEIGHGQVPFPDDKLAPTGISFGAIVQQATLSFAALRRVLPAAGAAEGRALLASLGLLAHVAAFGAGAFPSLRSGAELRAASSTWTWLGLDGPEEATPMSLDAATELFQACVTRAEAAGLPVGRQWADSPMVVTPGDKLAKAIRDSWSTE